MNRKKNMKREYQAYLYILPWILGFAILQLYPFVSSFIYSFTDYTVGAKATFQGLANYKKLFTQDKEFWNSLKVTILFALYTVPGKLIMALAVAMFLNRDLKGINLIRTLYYIPSLFGGSVAVALQIFGNMGGKIVSVGIMISAGGACNGFILSGSRTALYMAEQGDLPGSKALSKISGTGVPVNCIFLIGILGAIYALTGQFDLLTNLGTFVGWVFYTLTFLAVMAYRKQAPDLERTYKVPAYPVIPIIAIVSGLYVLLNQLFMAGADARKVAVGGIILVLIGLPVRAIFTKKKAA